MKCTIGVAMLEDCSGPVCADGDVSPPATITPARALMAHAIVAMGAGDAGTAVAHLEAALRLEPLDPSYHLLCGNAHLMAFGLDRARDYYRQALALWPGHAKARAGLWQVALLRGEEPCGMAQAGCTLPVHFRLPGGAMALTIDDGPTPDSTPAIMEVLDRHGVRATFFLVGARAEAYPHLVAKLVAAGHDIAPHGWGHHISTSLSGNALIEEMRRTEAVLSRFRPTPLRPWVRLPFGIGWDEPGVHASLRDWQSGCRIAQWGPTFQEWSVAEAHPAPGPAFDAACAQSVLKVFHHPESLDGAIILAHDHLIGVSGNTAHLAGPRTIDVFLGLATAAGHAVGPLPR